MWIVIIVVAGNLFMSGASYDNEADCTAFAEKVIPKEMEAICVDIAQGEDT